MSEVLLSSAKSQGWESRFDWFTSSLVGFLLLSLAPILVWWMTFRYILPDQIGFSFHGHTHVLAHIHDKATSGRYVRWLSLLGIFFAEFIAVGWTQCSLRNLFRFKDPSTRTDLVFYAALQANIPGTLGVITTLGISLLTGAWLRNEFVHLTGLTAGLYQLPLAAEVTALFFIYTFLDYWSHRMAHLPQFWPLHRFHHAAEEFNTLTASRTHPSDLSSVIVTTLPLALLGPSPAALAFLGLGITYIRYFIHSRFTSELGFIGRWLVQAPIHHRQHHAFDISVIPVSNFALCPLWDRMFGTFHPVSDPKFAIGIDYPYRHGGWFIPDFLRDYRDFGLSVWTWLKGSSKPAEQ